MKPLKKTGAIVGAFAVASLTVGAALAQSVPVLAPGVERVPDLKPVSTPYVVTNGTPVFRTPNYAPNEETGQELKRGERPHILGEANMGLYLLVGRDCRGVGYVPRSILCPAAVCSDIRR